MTEEEFCFSSCGQESEALNEGGSSESIVKKNVQAEETQQGRTLGKNGPEILEDCKPHPPPAWPFTPVSFQSLNGFQVIFIH